MKRIDIYLNVSQNPFTRFVRSLNLSLQVPNFVFQLFDSVLVFRLFGFTIFENSLSFTWSEKNIMLLSNIAIGKLHCSTLVPLLFHLNFLPSTNWIFFFISAICLKIDPRLVNSDPFSTSMLFYYIISFSNLKLYQKIISLHYFA